MTVPEESTKTPERPARRPSFGDVSYGSLRTAHLLWMTAVMPLAILHVRKSGVPLTELDGMIFYFAGCLWALMTVGIDQIAYPARIQGALQATGGSVMVILLSLFASDGNILVSAYTVFLASMVTQTVLFLVLSAWLVWKLRQELKARKETKFYIAMTLIFAGFFAFTAWYTAKFMIPFAAYVGRLEGTIPKVTACSSLALQVVAWGGMFYTASIFSKGTPEKAERESSFERWAAPVSIGMILSVVAGLFLFMA